MTKKTFTSKELKEYGDKVSNRRLKDLIKYIKSINGWGSHYMLPLSYAKSLIVKKKK